MQVVFLGGAAGVGASCLALQVGERWLLVDAGVRMGQLEDRLPDLAFLEGKDLAAILITHAHADHIGALPLVHQAFPATPIMTSPATARLMEVMLGDAVQVMARRALEELEVPLYDNTLVARTLRRLQPLPVGQAVTLPGLPGISVHSVRAGHVAGAVSLGITTPEGTLVLSGDVSLTPQRTVAPAAIPAPLAPDLLVLESTYGTRMHPNRRAEETRLAEAVAAGVERGGHVLIPAFALGRAQEVLLILQDAMRQGLIHRFPIYVDGLVRTVCAAYAAIPDALPPLLARRIAAGESIFFSGTVEAVSHPNQREQILAGPACCIVSSSGMLTGGPSAWYAARLAEREDATILITGYQDEEAPGRRLLDLAEGRAGTLTVGGTSVQVRCQVKKYALSAHADGSELAAYVQALKPRQVALVHGDDDARQQLAQRLTASGHTVVLPVDGQTLGVRSVGGAARRAIAPTLDSGGIGGGEPFGSSDLARLMAEVRRRGLAAASLRELALIWYGVLADADAEQALADVIAHTPGPLVPIPDAPGLYRIARDTESAPQVAPGALLLMALDGGALLPAICVQTQRASVYVLLPERRGNRSRFTFTDVRELVGWWPDHQLGDAGAVRLALATLFEQLRTWRRQNPSRRLVECMQPDTNYSFAELTVLMGIAADDLLGRLGLALNVRQKTELFSVTREANWFNERPAAYALAAGWEVALRTGVGDERPDQNAILQIVARQLGNPPDLYRRSVNPTTGDVTLQFHFPEVAKRRYAEAIAAAASEAGVAINVASQAHQGALVEAALALLPAGLTSEGTPAIFVAEHRVRLNVSGQAEPQELASAKQQFHEQTGWTLELALPKDSVGHETVATASGWLPPAGTPRLDQQQAIDLARRVLGASAAKIGAQPGSNTLLIRFPLPDADVPRAAEQLQEIADTSGWAVQVRGEAQDTALLAALLAALPVGVSLRGQPSLRRERRELVARCTGNASPSAIYDAQDQFAAQTGWRLLLTGLGEEI